MVSKTHLFIKIFHLLYRSFVSLIRISGNIKQKLTEQLRQTNWNYKRTEILKSSKVYFIKKNKLKIVYKIIHVQKQSSRGVLQKWHCTNTTRTHGRRNAQKRDPNKAALQLYWNHTHARMHLRESTSHLQNTTPQQNTSGRLLLYIKIVLKDLNFDLLFTTVKRDLLTLKNK